MRLAYAISLAVIFGWIADPVSSDETSGLEGEVGAAPALVRAQPLALGGHAEGDYLTARAMRLDALAAAQGEEGAAAPVTDALARALLDLAAFHLARGFIREGMNVLEAVGVETVAPDLMHRRDLLAASFSVLDPLGRSDLAAAVGILEESSGNLALALRAYGLQRIGENEAAAGLFSGSAQIVQTLPPSLVRHILPGLLSAAVAAEDWRLARGFAEQLMPVSDPREGALSFLLGQVALEAGDPLTAFDHFVEASAARDVWAHKARLVIVRLGLNYGAIEYDEALSMLARVDALWRGDDNALLTQLEMERIARAAGDLRSAALALGVLLSRYPNAPEAAAAEERAMTYIREYYAAGITGDLALDAFIEGHNELAADFRFAPGYEELSEDFADHMLAIGATAAAADEYRLTREYLEAAAELELYEVVPTKFDELSLREVEAHLASGNVEAAASLLRAGLRSGEPLLIERQNLLRARYAALTGEPIVDIGEELPNSEDVLRLVARSHVSDGAWEQAREAYVALWGLLEDDLPVADAIGLLVAAERSGDRHLAETVAPLLSGRSEALARVLLDDAAPNASGSELGSASAQALLDRADTALERVSLLADELVEDSSEVNEENQEQED